jgi:hypothetical protein
VRQGRTTTPSQRDFAEWNDARPIVAYKAKRALASQSRYADNKLTGSILLNVVEKEH